MRGVGVCVLESRAGSVGLSGIGQGSGGTRQSAAGPESGSDRLEITEAWAETGRQNAANRFFFLRGAQPGRQRLDTSVSVIIFRAYCACELLHGPINRYVTFNMPSLERQRSIAVLRRLGRGHST